MLKDIIQIIWEGGSLLVLGAIVFLVCLPAITPVDNHKSYTYVYDRKYKPRKSHAVKEGFHCREWDGKNNKWR